MTGPRTRIVGTHRTTHNTTLAEITFYTFDFGQIQLADAASQAKAVLSPSRARGALVAPLVGFQTTKYLGQAAGSWSIRLRPYMNDGRPWPELIKDGDWVRIDVRKNGAKKHVMAGRVDAVNVAVQAGGSGEPEITVTISGRDAGATAEDTLVYFNPYDPLHNNAQGIAMASLLTEQQGVIAGAPHELVPKLLTGLGRAGPYGQPAAVPAGLFFRDEVLWADALDTTIFVEECRGIVFAPHVLTPQSNMPIWAFASQFANPTMNECWIDTRIVGDYVAPYLYLRERPFENVRDPRGGPWFDPERIPHHVIGYSRVAGLSLARGRNRINHVFVLAELPSCFQLDAMALCPPVANLQSVKRWGLRRLEQRATALAENDDGGASAWQSENRAWRDLIVNWNALNGEHWSGIVSFAELIPELRVGHKLTLTGGPPSDYPLFPADGGEASKAMSFYVEAVQHSYEEGLQPAARTEVMVSRGFPEGDRLVRLQQELEGWGSVTTDEGSRNTATTDDPTVDDGEAA